MKKSYFKNILLILPVFLLVFFSTCSHTVSKNKDLLGLESILPAKPDSVLTLLDSLQSANIISSSKDIAHFQLIKVYAQFLSDIVDVDSLMAKEVHDYYSNNFRQSKEAGIACFLYGYVLAQHDNVDEGVICLKKSIDCLASSDTYNLLGLANYYIAYYYSEDAAYERALPRFQQAASYFEKADETVNLAYSYRQIGDAYDLARYPIDSSLIYFEKAKRLLLAQKDTAGYYDVLFYESVSLLNRTERFVEAKDNLLKVYHYYDEDEYYQNKLSYAYARCNIPDSALFYYRLCQGDTLNLYSKMAVSMAGAYSYMSAGDYKNASAEFIKYNKNRTELFNESYKLQMSRIDKGFELMKKEREISQLLAKQRNSIISFGLLFVLLIAIGIAFLLTFQKRRRENMQHVESIGRLETNTKNQRHIIQTKIQSRIDAALKIKKTEHKLRTNASDAKLVLADLLLQSSISEDEWPDYIKEIDIVCNNHIHDLSVQFPALTYSDKIVIALTSMNTDITDACLLLAMTKNTMYKRRSTIKERLGLDKSIELDSWIADRVASYISSNKH